jgi:nucleoside recognition membrane protein YjiH
MNINDFTFEVIAALFSDLYVYYIARNTARYEHNAFVVAAHSLAFVANISELHLLDVWYASISSAHGRKSTSNSMSIGNEKGRPRGRP